MKYKSKEIFDFMDMWAKKEYMMSWDNSGMQIYFDTYISNILLCLDVDDKSLEMAKNNNCQAIISHHPLFFGGEKNIIEGSYRGDLILSLINNKISVYSGHTTLDVVSDGVNFSLARFLDLKNQESLALDDGLPIGIVGELKEEKSIEEILKNFRDKLNIKNIRTYGKDKKIKKVSLCGGAGSSYMDEVIKNGSQLFISGDIKYHDGQYAYENNIIAMDIGHFHSEKLILPRIKEKLLEKFSELNIFIKDDSSYEMFWCWIYKKILLKWM